MQPTLSIVTINYNNRSGLARTYASLPLAIDENVEHITIDGGSTDGSIEVMNEFTKTQNNAKGFTGPDQGIFNAMNKGWKMASGKYVAFVNSGDEIIPGNYRQFVKFLSTFKAEVFYSKTIIRSEDGSNSFTLEAHPRDLLKKSIPHPGCAVNRETLESINGFDEKYRICADREMLVKLWHRGASFKFFPHETTIFYEGGASSPRATRAEDLEINRIYRHISRPRYFIKKFTILTQETLRVIQKRSGGL